MEPKNNRFGILLAIWLPLPSPPLFGKPCQMRDKQAAERPGLVFLFVYR
jgi:hypothetical protein